MDKRRKLLLAGLALLVLLGGAGGVALTKRPDPIDKAIAVQREELEKRPEFLEDTAQSAVNFQALWAVNPDICAWLTVPGTDISYPVLLRELEEDFYLTHGENGKKSPSGALFIQNYNRRDCSDPAVAVYGHRMRSGAYFGSLQESFETEEGFRSHPTLRLYLPDRVVDYRVFAAVPYNSTHLLYTYHFENPYEYKNFIDRIYAVRSFLAHTDESLRPQFGDRLLILSTCLTGDNTQRYLVLGRMEMEREL